MILKTHPTQDMTADQLLDAELFVAAVGGFLETPVCQEDGLWRSVVRYWQEPLLACDLDEAKAAVQAERLKRNGHERPRLCTQQ